MYDEVGDWLRLGYLGRDEFFGSAWAGSLISKYYLI